MATRTTDASSFGIEVTRSAPTSRIVPGDQTKVLGAIIRLDGRASMDPDEDGLTWVWSFLSTPMGSQLVDTDLRDVEGDNSVVTFAPDIPGPYSVSLTVATPYIEAASVSASVLVQTILASSVVQSVPDATWMYKLLSDFWRLVEDNGVFPVVWSGLIQTHSADLLRLLQVDYAKSISTIQPLFQREWLDYSPRLELSSAQHHGFHGYSQSGTTAFTPGAGQVVTGIIIGTTEFLLLEGRATSQAVGNTLTVFSSAGSPGNLGDYQINSLNSEGSGYIISSSAPFPTPADDLLASSSDMVLYALSDEVSSTATDFVVADVGIGDMLRVEGGEDRGYFRVTGVGVADGLPNDRTLRLDRTPTATKSNLAFSVFNRVRATSLVSVSPLTASVYIPEADADLSAFETRDVTGSGSVIGPFELLVESRHVFTSLVGQSIQVNSGVNAGRSYAIAAVNSSQTGYLIGSVFLGPFPQETVTYTLPVVSDITDRLLVLNGRAHGIVSATLETDLPDIADGGRGPLWAITLSEATAVSAKENISWSISSTLVSEEYEDLEELGVRKGDLLIFEVERVDNNARAILPASVLGAVGSRLAFEVGTKSPVDGTLTATETLEFFEDLRIPNGGLDPISGEALLSYTAADMASFVQSTSFSSAYFNFPISSSSVIDFGEVQLRIRASYLVRNSLIPVDTDIVSIPSLFEYIAPTTTAVDEEGVIRIVGKDQSATELSHAPYVFQEGLSYSLSSPTNVSGANAQTTAGSGLIVLPLADLIDRGVEEGESLELVSGFDQAVYVIQEVVDYQTVRVVGADGVTVPGFTSESVRYEVNRRKAAQFIQFAEGVFTPDSTLPDRFWAKTTFFDNSGYIDDNFGALVGITREQLDEFGTSQISYLGTVSALMYAYVNGPTVRNAEIGSHILLGLPVTEVNGQVIDIDAEYSETSGRILIEDVNEDGTGTGLTRIYLYRRADAASLEDFAGLAVNPDTGAEYAVYDYVDAFSPLSKGVIVSDYVNDPDWWQVAGKASGSTELRKFHTWQVQADASAIDARDMALVSEFLNALRPIYTQPNVVLTLYLLDEVSCTDSLLLDVDLYLFDDPAFSLEQTHMVDSYSGSSLPQRLHDFGSLATRTLFEGDDLVSTAGSATLTSTRGGFVSELTGVNDAFPSVTTLGTSLVQPGDLVFIWAGPNRARWEVVSVTDDNTLMVVEPSESYPPRTYPTAEIVGATGQRFYIQRRDVNPVVSGSATTSVGSRQIVDATGNFTWNNASIDDWLVIEAGADKGLHRIVDIGYDSGGGLANPDTDLTVAAALTATATETYRIVRKALLVNPLENKAGSTTAASNTVVSTDMLLSFIRFGDIFTPSSGTDSGVSFVVVDVLSDTQFVVDAPLTTTEAITFEVNRPGLSSHPDTDALFEAIAPEDRVELTVFRPRSVFVAVPVATFVLGSTTVDTGATSTAGVTTDMVLEVDAAATNTGAWEVTAIPGGFSLDIETEAASSEAVAANVLQDSADFDVVNATVASNTGVNLEFMNVDNTASLSGTPSFNSGSTAVTGAGTLFLSEVQPGQLVKVDAHGVLTWTRVLSVTDDTNLVLVENYRGATAAAVSSVSDAGGGIRMGDVFRFSTGDFVVLSVAADTATLTQTTGIGALTAFTGRFIRGAL